MTAQQNFFALIKDDGGSCQIKRLRVNQSLQNELIEIFNTQRSRFEQGVDTEIAFNGDWKPDSNEIMTLENLDESELMVNAINANASSFPDLDISNFSDEPIKALFSGFKENGRTTVLVQKFTSRQALSLAELPIIKMQTGNTFVKTTDTLFTIDNKLVAIIENEKTKFKSFHNARMVFELTEYYKEATDEDLNNLSQHSSLEITSLENFMDIADSQIRKMAHSIQNSQVLDTYSVSDIATAASSFPDIRINVNNGKIILPEDKKELKEVMHFLLEDIYRGPLSGNEFLTNSKREL